MVVTDWQLVLEPAKAAGAAYIANYSKLCYPVQVEGCRLAASNSNDVREWHSVQLLATWD